MDNEMIERVAKAILETPNASDYKTLVVINAIKAMREPTEKMLEAGIYSNPTQWTNETDVGFAKDVANDVWIGMIDTVINDK